jgi:hypothetical protein
MRAGAFKILPDVIDPDSECTPRTGNASEDECRVVVERFAGNERVR